MHIQNQRRAQIVKIVSARLEGSKSLAIELRVLKMRYIYFIESLIIFYGGREGHISLKNHSTIVMISGKFEPVVAIADGYTKPSWYP